MKAVAVAVAAGSLVGAASALDHHNHMQFHAKRHQLDLEVRSEPDPYACVVHTTVVYGEPTLKPNPPPCPTPVITSYTAPGTYTVPGTTITVEHTTTVPAGTTYVCPSGGEYTYGGSETTVTIPTTVTVPVCSVSGTGEITETVITSTTHYCSTAGACTPVPPHTTSVSTSTIVVYPIPATYTPGTYTRPESTITIHETNTVYVCPYAGITSTVTATPIPAPTKHTPKPAPYSPPAAPYEAPKPAPYEAPAKPAPAPKEHKPAAAPAPKKPAPAAPAPPAANGDKWAMTYTPYTTDGQCKSAGDVDSDLADVASMGFTAVRIYGTDCSALANVGGSAKKHGLKLIAGVFIDAGGIAKAQSQVEDLKTWGSAGNWGNVEMIVVGNEAIFNGYCTPSSLAGFISSAKGEFKGAGYTGPVTTTEPVGTFLTAAPALCDVVDVVGANIQPFFNPTVTSAHAGSFVASQLDLVGEQCPGKEAYNLECGWPSQGLPNGLAIPGADQQKQAVGGVLGSKAAGRSVIFGYQNDAWKPEGPFKVEPWFGCAAIIPGLV